MVENAKQRLDDAKKEQMRREYHSRIPFLNSQSEFCFKMKRTRIPNRSWLKMQNKGWLTPKKSERGGRIQNRKENKKKKDTALHKSLFNQCQLVF